MHYGIKQIAIIVASIVGAALIIALAARNRELRHRHLALIEQVSHPRVGVFVPTFRATTLDGAPVAIGATEGERQVLFFFTTTCTYCIASLPAWRQIATSAAIDSNVIELYGISLDSVEATRTYAAEHALPFPVVLPPEAKLAALYRIRGVPVVLVLDSAGRTMYARRGAITTPGAIDSVIAAMLETGFVSRQ